VKVQQNVPILVRHPGVFLRPRRYVFVLSHMRSYSSLLCHILGSHPEVAGYAEMHQRYNGPLDLFRLRARVSRSLGGDLRGRFVLDKVLHNDYAIAPSVLALAGTYPIFLVRDPADSMPSIIELGARVPNAQIYSDPDSSSSYYVGRLHELARLARERHGNALFVRAEDLIDATRTTLDAIARFLELDQPLQDVYTIFERTGEPGWGDDSELIRAGRVVQNRAQRDVTGIPEEPLRRAVEAYVECCRILERHCDTARADGERAVRQGATGAR
jgi:hypothetical protein